MKFYKVLAVVAIAAIVTSCFPMQRTAANTSIPTTTQTSGGNGMGSILTSGLSIGAALLALYQQYKNYGSLNLSNINNLVSLSTLANNVQGITDRAKDAAFLNDIISGSENLVNKDNLSTVLTTLGQLANSNLNKVTAQVSNLSSAAGTSTISKINNSKEVKDAAAELTSLFDAIK